MLGVAWTCKPSAESPNRRQRQWFALAAGYAHPQNPSQSHRPDSGSSTHVLWRPRGGYSRFGDQIDAALEFVRLHDGTEAAAN